LSVSAPSRQASSSVRQVTHRQSVVQATAVRAGSKIAERAGSPSAFAPGQVAHATGLSGQQGKSSLAPGHAAKPAVTKHAKHGRVVVHSRPPHVQPVKPQPAPAAPGANAHTGGQGKN
jgi:hypothetical protein